MINFREAIRSFRDDESAQGIAEYGAILALVSLLVGLVFGFAKGNLQSAVSASFSCIMSQLNQMNKDPSLQTCG